MKVYLLSLSLFIGFVFSSFVFAQGDRESAKSVVKVTCSFIVKENGREVTKIANASGWCWKNSRYIITALHEVAGIRNEDIKVYTDQERSASGARVIRILKEADLALLELTAELGLTPLNLEPVDPNASDEFSIWGFPNNVFSMSGDDIRFSRSLSAVPTLNSIIGNDALKRELELQTYPLTRAQIIRISSTIQPGHSGAPIMKKNGRVVGIADGGLREGTARLNWAMPASVYVERLLTSTDVLPDPRKRSLQSNLYSSVITVETTATKEDINNAYKQEAKSNTIVYGGKSITKTWSGTYDQILATMPPDQAEPYRKVTYDVRVNMSDTRFDIYEDFKTGATVVMPSNENFNFALGAWFNSSDQASGISISASPWPYQSFEAAKQGALTVLERTFPRTQWNLSPQHPDEAPEINNANQWATYKMTRVSKDGHKTAFYTAQVYGQTILISYLMYDETRFGEPAYYKKYLHYYFASCLARFSTKSQVNVAHNIFKQSTYSYDQILATLPPESANAYRKIANDGNAFMANTKYDNYKDGETGIVFSIPAFENTEISKDGWLLTASADRTISYIAMPVHSDSYENAKAFVNSTIQLTFPTTVWFKDTRYADVPPVINDYTKTATYFWRLINQQGEILLYKGVVNGQNLLITYIQYNENMRVNPAYNIKYMQYYFATYMLWFTGNK